MINSPNSRISNMAKDFGVKSKTILDILEANGITGKKNTATLTPDEYGMVIEGLTRGNQISNMTQYLAGEVDIPRAKTEAKAEVKTEAKAEAKAEAEAEAKAELSGGRNDAGK